MVSRKLAPPGGIQGTALEIFGGLASSYERALDLATMTQDRYWKCWVVENASIRAGDRVLDIGCGTCLLEERLEDTGCMVVGLDLTEQMIRIGQSKNLVCLEGLLVGDAEALPFPDGTFDAVVCCYVPKYVDRARFAREVARVLRAGGKVVSYDFVRPAGPFSLLLRLYLHGAMPITAYLLGLVGSEAATTFRNLPRIVEGARWSEGIAEIFGVEGVQTLVSKTLSGGVVGVFSGVKEPKQP
ncbi:MAG: class I SAM-dependent methyltransferase [Nitrososphaerales archaeon]